MGLLEKAQQRKQEIEEAENLTESIVEEVRPSGLLEKAKQRKQKITTGTIQKKTKAKDLKEPEKQIYSGLKAKEGKIDILEEEKGFGWKGLGSRRIVFDHNINEYRYELSEPALNKMEMKTKNELTRLFKMLADVNVYDIDDEKKKKYLEETLEQIIVDNDIKFDLTEKEKTEKKSFLNLNFILRRGKNKEKETKERKTEDGIKTKKKNLIKNKKARKGKK